MIESAQMNKKEEEEKNINRSNSVFCFRQMDFKSFLDIKSSWKSAEPVNDDLRKFRNYQI